MKNALIYAFEESKWFSCTKIVQNLLLSYNKVLDQNDLIRINYDFDSSDFSIDDTAEAIVNQKPDRLIFLDHRPHPLSLLKKIFEINIIEEYKPEIIFHIYGDFTLNIMNWFNLEMILENRKVKFLCASLAQSNLMRKILKYNKNVFEVPFPVSKDEFNLTRNNELFNLRTKLNISDDSIILIYTGRLSLLKNVEELCKLFLRAFEMKKVSQKCHLVLVGSFDNIGFSFGNKNHLEGELFRSFDRMICEFSPELRSHIHFLGNISNKDLKDYYLDSDYFISLSTYHDEDYGMSVAEAGSCGCKMILTEWAGYKTFALTEHVKYVKTKLTENGPVFSLSDVSHCLHQIKKNNSFTRKKINECFSSLYIENVFSVLEDALNKEVDDFIGFNNLFRMLSRKAKLDRALFYDPINNEMTKEYISLYESYASKN